MLLKAWIWLKTGTPSNKNAGGWHDGQNAGGWFAGQNAVSGTASHNQKWPRQKGPKGLEKLFCTYYLDNVHTKLFGISLRPHKSVSGWGYYNWKKESR